ncbi:MAG TPA: hypothetical protein DEA96_14635 [Leptospiraceae bacterium]|nr:hypothetical protein [Spirochaetaceae bacterium]HBS06202.1 hypothetical protein [Leptospiraceae bacterium]|tara:strand:+ start:7184 stop:8137 length:954 start_codon:yes stop_codon:yes gene_type:complete
MATEPALDAEIQHKTEAQRTRTTGSSLVAVLLIVFSMLPITGTCGDFQRLCRSDDPGCSETSLLTFLTLASLRAVYWGDITNSLLYKMDDGTMTATPRIGVPSLPRELSFSADGRTLWMANGAQVLRISMVDGANTTITSSPSDVMDLVVLEEEGIIYYSDNGSGQIDTTDLSGGNYTTVFGPGSNEAMDLDAENEHLYMVDNNQLKRFNFDGTGEIVLVASVGLTFDLELDLAAGKIYWADGTSSEIHSANLDGSNEQVLISGLSSPRGIAVSPASPYIYFCDFGNQAITRILRDGTDPVVVSSGYQCQDVDFASR